jgi:threonine synthase
MKYISTRGLAPDLGFADAVLAGLAEDGGLYVPASWPAFDPHEIAPLARLAYPELALKIISRFTGGEIGEGALKRIIDESYATFRHKSIAPLVQIDRDMFILELFHGETLAFKDFALQFLGRLLDYLLKERAQKATILGATSGDTGSAAIAGCRGSDNMRIFILHPKGRVSEVQRRMMTTYPDANIHNIAIRGTFDDCQNIVKELFTDLELRKSVNLTAVNSINWVRILAQVVYYFYAALRVGAPFRKVIFSVPTGNFGDIYAGFVAQQLGLPIQQLIVGTNSNDILNRFMHTGEYKTLGVVQTISPSIDIQISSNFERLLFNVFDMDANFTRNSMEAFKKTGSLQVTPQQHNKIRQLFSSDKCSEEETIATMQKIYAECGYLADPHTAVGIKAALGYGGHHDYPTICLATAHPAKFPDAVIKATGVNPPLPAHHADLFAKPERMIELANSANDVRNILLP